uniref:Uncharacterized protein n=1 Tax=Panagrolaimus sp. JU765 TaxID=591449 RepID=A0AC34PW76_9BILA
MRISKVWQWIQDKKTNTIRKWRSAFIGGGTASTFEGGQRFFASELEVPESTLKPIGGSFNVLTRPQSDKMPRKKDYKKRRASEKYFSGKEPLIVKDDWEQDNFSDDPPLLESSYQNFDLLYDNYPGLDDYNEAGPSYINHGDVYDDFDEELLLKVSPPRKKTSAVGSAPGLTIKDNGRRVSEASVSESEPGYEKRKKLRFNIPQVGYRT